MDPDYDPASGFARAAQTMAETQQILAQTNQRIEATQRLDQRVLHEVFRIANVPRPLRQSPAGPPAQRAKVAGIQHVERVRVAGAIARQKSDGRLRPGRTFVFGRGRAG